MDLSKVQRDDWILAAVALLLAIDLLFLPWFSVSAGPFSVTFTATDAPDGWIGVLALLATMAVIADLAIERLSPQTSLPALRGSRAATRLVLAVTAAALMALKFILHIHFSLFGIGFYLGVVLAAALVYLAWQAHQGVAFAMPGRLAHLGGRSGPIDPPTA